MKEVEQHQGSGPEKESAAPAVDSQDALPPSSVDLSASSQSHLLQPSPADGKLSESGAGNQPISETVIVINNSQSQDSPVPSPADGKLSESGAGNQPISETVIVINSSQSQDSPVPSSGEVSVPPPGHRRKKRVWRLKKGENKKSKGSQETAAKEKIDQNVHGGTIWEQLGAFKCAKCGFTATTENIYKYHICKSKKSTPSVPTASSSILNSQAPSAVLPTVSISRTNRYTVRSSSSSIAEVGTSLQSSEVRSHPGRRGIAASFPGYDRSTSRSSQAANGQESSFSRQGTIVYLPNKNAYKCKQCCFVGRGTAFIEHLMYQVVAVPYHCQYCKKSFAERTLLHQHFESEHPTQKRKCKLRKVSAITGIMDTAKSEIVASFSLHQAFQSCVGKQLPPKKAGSVPSSAQNVVASATSVPVSSTVACVSTVISTTSSIATAASGSSTSPLLSSRCDLSNSLEGGNCSSRVYKSITALQDSSLTPSSEQASSLQTTPTVSGLSSLVPSCGNDQVTGVLDQNDGTSLVGNKSPTNSSDFNGATASNAGAGGIVQDTDSQLPIIISCQGNYADHEQGSGDDNQFVATGGAPEGLAPAARLEKQSNPVEASSPVTVSLTSVTCSSGAVSGMITSNATIVNVTSCSSLDHAPLHPRSQIHDQQVTAQMTTNTVAQPAEQTVPFQPDQTTSSHSRLMNIQPVNTAAGLQAVLSNIMSQAALQASHYSLPLLPQTTSQSRLFTPVVGSPLLGMNSATRYHFFPLNYVLPNNVQPAILRQAPQVRPQTVPSALPLQQVIRQSGFSPVNTAMCVRPGPQRTSAIQGTLVQDIHPQVLSSGLSQRQIPISAAGSTETGLGKLPSMVSTSETENTFPNYSPISPASGSPGPIYTPISPASPVYTPVSPASPHRNYSPISPPLPQNCARSSTHASASPHSQLLDLTVATRPLVSSAYNMSAQSQSPHLTARRLDFVSTPSTVSETAVSVSGATATAGPLIDKTTSSSCSAVPALSETLHPHTSSEISKPGSAESGTNETASPHIYITSSSGPVVSGISETRPHIDSVTSSSDSVICSSGSALSLGTSEAASPCVDSALAPSLQVSVADTPVGRMKEEKEDRDFQHASVTVSTCPPSSSTGLPSGLLSVPFQNYFIKYKDSFACLRCHKRFHDYNAFYIHVWNHQHVDSKLCTRCCDSENQTSNQIKCTETTQIVEAVSAIANAGLLDQLPVDCREKFTRRLLQGDTKNACAAQEDNKSDSDSVRSSKGAAAESVEATEEETTVLPTCNSPNEAQGERDLEKTDETLTMAVTETAATISSESTTAQKPVALSTEGNGDPAPCVVSSADENCSTVSESRSPGVSEDSAQVNSQSPSGDDHVNHGPALGPGTGHDAGKSSGENEIVTESKERSSPGTAEVPGTRSKVLSAQADGEAGESDISLNSDGNKITKSFEEAQPTEENGGVQVLSAVLHSWDRGLEVENRQVSQELGQTENINPARLGTRTMAEEKLIDRSAVFFICALCDFSCFLAVDFTMHLNSAHHDEQVFPCYHCNYQGKYTTDLTNHITAHTEGDSRMLYLCPCAKSVDCSYRTDNLKDLGNHIQHHPGNNFWCHNCHTPFEDDTELLQHLMQNSMTLFSCSKCSSRFLNKRAIQHHGKTEHSGRSAFFKVMKVLLCKERKENNYKPPVNGLPVRRLSTEEELSSHLREQNPASKPPWQAPSLSKHPAVDEVPTPETIHGSLLPLQGSAVCTVTYPEASSSAFDTVPCSETGCSTLDTVSSPAISYSVVDTVQCPEASHSTFDTATCSETSHSAFDTVSSPATSYSVVDRVPCPEISHSVVDTVSCSETSHSAFDTVSSPATSHSVVDTIPCSEISDSVVDTVPCSENSHSAFDTVSSPATSHSVVDTVPCPETSCSAVHTVSYPTNSKYVFSEESDAGVTIKGFCTSKLLPSEGDAESITPVARATSASDQHSESGLTMEQESVSELTVDLSEFPTAAPCDNKASDETKRSKYSIQKDKLETFRRCVSKIVPKPQVALVIDEDSPSEPVNVSDSSDDSPSCIIASVDKPNMSTVSVSPSETSFDVAQSTAVKDLQNIDEVLVETVAKDPSGEDEVPLATSEDESTAAHDTTLESGDETTAKASSVQCPEEPEEDRIHLRDLFGSDQLHTLMYNKVYFVHMAMFYCPICDAKVGSKKLIQEHLFGHFLPLVMCNLCQFSCTSKEDLVRHFGMNHTGKEKIRINLMVNKTMLLNKLRTSEPLTLQEFGDICHEIDPRGADNNHSSSSITSAQPQERNAKKSNSTSVNAGLHFGSGNIVSNKRPAAHFSGDGGSSSVPGKSGESKEPGNCGIKSSTRSMIHRRRSSGHGRTASETVDQKKVKSKEAFARPKPGTFWVVKVGAISKFKCRSCESLTLSPAGMKLHLETCTRYLNSQRDHEHTAKAASLAEDMRLTADNKREQHPPQAVTMIKESKGEKLRCPETRTQEHTNYVKKKPNGWKQGQIKPKIHPKKIFKLGISRSKSLPEARQSSSSQHMKLETTSSKYRIRKETRKSKLMRLSVISSSSSEDDLDALQPDSADKQQPNRSEAVSKPQEIFQKVKQVETKRNTYILDSSTSESDNLAMDDSSDQQSLTSADKFTESQGNAQETRSLSSPTKTMVCHDSRQDEADSRNEDVDSDDVVLHKEIEQTYKCKYCCFSAQETHTKELQGHMQEKHPEVLKLAKCGHCDYVYNPAKDASRLKKHTENYHPGKEQSKETLPLSFFYNAKEKENCSPKYKMESAVSTVQRSESASEVNDIEVIGNEDTTMSRKSIAKHTGPKFECAGAGSATQEVTKNPAKQTALSAGTKRTSSFSSSDPVNEVVTPQKRARSIDPEEESTIPLCSTSQTGAHETKGHQIPLETSSGSAAKRSKKSSEITKPRKPLPLKDKSQQKDRKRNTSDDSDQEMSADEFLYNNRHSPRPGRKRERSSRERRRSAKAACLGMQAQLKGDSDNGNSSDDDDDDFDVDVHKKQVASKKAKRFAFLDTEEFKNSKKGTEKLVSKLLERESLSQEMQDTADRLIVTHYAAPDGDPKASASFSEASANEKSSAEKHPTGQSMATSPPASSTVDASRQQTDTKLGIDAVRFVCVMCDQHHADVRKIKAHLSRHVNYCTILCNWCSEEFMSVKDAKAHHQVAHKDKDYVMNVVRQPMMEVKLEKLIRESREKAERNSAAARAVPSDQAGASVNVGTKKLDRPRTADPSRQFGEWKRSIQCRLCQSSHYSLSEFKNHFYANHADSGKEKEWVDVKTQNVYNLKGKLIKEGTIRDVVISKYMCGHCSFRCNTRDFIMQHKTDAHPGKSQWSLLLQTSPSVHVSTGHNLHKKTTPPLSTSSAVVTNSPASSISVSSQSRAGTACSSYWPFSSKATKSGRDAAEPVKHGPNVAMASRTESTASLYGMPDEDSDLGRGSAKAKSLSADAKSAWEIHRPVANDPKLQGVLRIQLQDVILCPKEMHKLLLDNGITRARLSNKGLSSKDRKILESAKRSL